MQVNVKELTGVLHLNLVFMTVLVLQSFLAVSFQVFPSVTSLLKCVVSTIPNSQQSQVFCKCDKHFEPLV